MILWIEVDISPVQIGDADTKLDNGRLTRFGQNMQGKYISIGEISASITVQTWGFRIAGYGIFVDDRSFDFDLFVTRRLGGGQDFCDNRSLQWGL